MKATEYNCIVGVMPKEGFVESACQSFFCDDNNKDVKAFF